MKYTIMKGKYLLIHATTEMNYKSIMPSTKRNQTKELEQDDG